MNKLLLLIFLTACFASCDNEETLFKKISSSHSGIEFNNRIVESDSINPLDVVNIYNGGGVGVGDFNNDGLQDIYFAGNMVSNKLYLNKGKLTFEDATNKAGVEGKGRWARGVSVVDINNDGLLDIYICNTIRKDSLKRQNILYVNEGVDKIGGTPHFKDMAPEYGLDMHWESTMANFFDYDNDGDLDVYITVNTASVDNNPTIFLARNRKSNPSLGKLYRNDFDSLLDHPVYKDVSELAGINLQGFGHGATVVDINMDGWKDIYVSDDFISSNLLYINNHNGTFTDRTKEYFKHTSLNAMGQDIIDINNDGLADVFELDMSPEDNYRKKMMLNGNNYNTIQNFTVLGYQFQYVRNTLQINQGPRLFEGDSIGAPAFSEVGFLSGLAQTDWSWTPLIADFNNDSRRDIIVTNGFPRDVSDHDFIAYRKENYALTSKADLLSNIPEIKIHNYAFENKDGLQFSNVTDAWGLATPSFSNGAAYADFDNDGDIDMVVNNVNDKAFLYQNTLRDKNDTSSHFLQVSLEGNAQNRKGIGATVSIYYGGTKQVYENTPYRGYLSTHQNTAHFGLGKTQLVDSIIVDWNNQQRQIIRNVKADQGLKLKITDAVANDQPQHPFVSTTALFKEVTSALGLSYNHVDFDFIDYNFQTTLPHKLSEYCPALAAGDIDGNGLDDLIIGGNFTNQSQVFFQQPNGKFIQRNLFVKSDTTGITYKEQGLLLLDVNGDGSLDVYIVSGGYQFDTNSPNYGDRLYLNDGKGNFSLTNGALPANYTSKLCVRSMDYNKDGKPDLFISGRVDPHNYPKPVSSFIYRNDSQNGIPKFTDVTDQVAPELKNIGMVCDALFSDFDGDNELDLILAGEWMPVSFFKNTNGRFKNSTATTGINNQTGWWNSITAGDFRHTGRIDYIIGNVGLNTLYKATEQYPAFITANDFDKNGGYEAIPSIFLPDKKGEMKEFPAHGRDDIIDKMPVLKKKFNNYSSFAKATMNEIFTDEQRKGALRLTANNSQSCYIRNDDNGKFTLIPLPIMAQVSMLNGMITDDFDGDGNLDVLINGNDYGTEVSVGRYDALNGLLLKGDGKGQFRSLSILESGIFIPGNGKALVTMKGANGNYLIAASQHRDALKAFELRKRSRFIDIKPSDQYAIIKYRNGQIEKREFYFGSSFLSQSSRFILVTNPMLDITIVSTKGEKRLIQL